MDSKSTVLSYQRTLDAKPNESSIVKPGELVDIVEMTPLSLTDRRIYNQLIGNAWGNLDKPHQHVIPKAELQNTLHKGTERLEDSIKKLMTAIVEVRVSNRGKWETKRVQLLGGNVVPDADDGLVRYDFHPIMLQIIAESRVFARLHKKIMFALSSKYSLTLYEMIQKRGNMAKNFEEMTIDEFRAFLGVPPNKLTSWINFKNFAITPAVKEVSDLSDYLVTVEPIKAKKGRLFTGVRLSWERKQLPELKEVERELERPKVGRKARLSGTVDEVESALPSSGVTAIGLPSLRGDTIGKARKLIPGYDIYEVEARWREWARGKERPANADAAFLAFCKVYAKNNPI